MNESLFIESKEARNEYAQHYEVLEKVKELLLVPGLDVMTTKQVATYYEVGIESIKNICRRHIDELKSDGMHLEKLDEFLKVQNEPPEKLQGKTILTYGNGITLDISNRGMRVFPRRAILRIGMLLRDSAVAKEVRTQLLNIEGKTSKETKIQDINEEQSLMLAVGMAVASGDATAVAVASANLVEFKNRHIKQLENDNKALSSEILEWNDRRKLNAGVRKLASVMGKPFSDIWNELYKNLQYKHGICIKQRGNSPYIQWVKEQEWDKVVKTFCAMCEAYKQSPTEMFQQITPLDNLRNK